MKEITFRPLRRVKKTGRIAVASYYQWRQVFAADQRLFRLTVDDTYKSLPVDEVIYSPDGQPLFWRDFNPADIAVIDFVPGCSLARIRAAQPQGYALRWSPTQRPVYSCSRRGLDCDGVPTFSHHTINHVADHCPDFTEYEPLTVGIVVKWFGWFLYRLENTSLQIGR